MIICPSIILRTRNVLGRSCRENQNTHFIILCFPDRASYYRLFQITNLMHNSFIFQQYVCYTTILNMFRAARCSSSGVQIVSPQPLLCTLILGRRFTYRCNTFWNRKHAKMTISKLKGGCAPPRAMFRGDTLAVGSRTASDLAEMRNGYLPHTSYINLPLHRACSIMSRSSSFPHLNNRPPTVNAKFNAYLK